MLHCKKQDKQNSYAKKDLLQLQSQKPELCKGVLTDSAKQCGIFSFESITVREKQRELNLGKI